MNKVPEKSKSADEASNAEDFPIDIKPKPAAAPNVRLLLGAQVEELSVAAGVMVTEDWGIVAPPELRVSARAYAEAFALQPAPAERHFQLIRSDASPDSYRIHIVPNRIEVEAGNSPGFYYALETLQRMRGCKYTGCMRGDDTFPLGRIAAAPQFPFRGVHLPPLFNPRLTAHGVVEHIRCCGRNRINKVIIEYGDMFPWRDARLRCRRAYTPEDIVRFRETAREHHIELIPLQSMFGHQRHWLQVEGYRRLAEPQADPSDLPWQICPNNPGAVRAASEMLEEIIAAHPDSQYVHIGCDEARCFGQCPACKAEIARDGVDKHLLRAINRFADVARGLGRRPIAWHDMVVNHVTALDQVDRNLVLMYWDYWTSSMRNPLMTCWWRPQGQPPFGAAYDERWGTEWPLDELDDKARLSLGGTKHFPRLETLVPKAFLEKFGAYIGDEFPKYIKPFFYSSYLKDQGFDVINASACTEKRGGDFFHLFPDPVRGIGNIYTATRAAIRDQLLGAIVTNWYNYPPGFYYTAIMAQGHFAWNPETNEREDCL